MHNSEQPAMQNTQREPIICPTCTSVSFSTNGFDGCIQGEDGDGFRMARAAVVVPFPECSLTIIGQAVQDDAALGHEWPILLRNSKDAVFLRKDQGRCEFSGARMSLFANNTRGQSVSFDMAGQAPERSLTHKSQKRHPGHKCGLVRDLSDRTAQSPAPRS